MFLRRLLDAWPTKSRQAFDQVAGKHQTYAVQSLEQRNLEHSVGIAFTIPHETYIIYIYIYLTRVTP